MEGKKSKRTALWFWKGREVMGVCRGREVLQREGDFAKRERQVKTASIAVLLIGEK